MSRLDDYRNALLVVQRDTSDDVLAGALEDGSGTFSAFIVDHGLGPMWHERTARDEFYLSRMQAEALFAAQESVLREIRDSFDNAGVDHVVIKGAANRLLLYDNPAARACHDLDLLVRPDDRITAAQVLVDSGFAADPKARNISRALELSRDQVNIDLHWGLVREGRLRRDPVADMLERRRSINGMWMLGAEDALFALLVHPAFAKHLAGWTLGLHRVADLLAWIRCREFDWPMVQTMLGEHGVRAAAWATLRWTQMIAGGDTPPLMHDMLADLAPGRLRSGWLDFWLRNNLPDRASAWRWTRLLGFSLFLHDTAADGWRAAAGRHRAGRRSQADLEFFRKLVSE